MASNTDSWMKAGAHAVARADSPTSFIRDYISGLLIHLTGGQHSSGAHTSISTEEEFWRNEKLQAFDTIKLGNFRLCDWFPRAPGVFWSERGFKARNMVYASNSLRDPKLGEYYSPQGKANLIERGGIGTIRLRPRKVDDHYCWFGTALTGRYCHAGIPLAIPHYVLQEAAVGWGDEVRIEGQIRFLQDAGLNETRSSVHHAKPFVVFVEKLKGVKRVLDAPITITPVALFGKREIFGERETQAASYTFVQCRADSRNSLEQAGEWIDLYATKHGGNVITNYDEQQPILADAPLSYQRLLAGAHDPTVIENFFGTLEAKKVNQFINTNIEKYMENNISTGGSAIININSVLNHVTQTIGASSGLDSEQKEELTKLVNSMKTQLASLTGSHPQEVSAITNALDNAVGAASKPKEERKRSILALSADGLKSAANLVKDVAPTVLTTATAIAQFIASLS